MGISHSMIDYRHAVAGAMRKGGMGEHSIQALLDGLSRQTIRDHQTREHETGAPAEEIVTDALVKGLGYTRDAAKEFADGFVLARWEYEQVSEAISGIIESVDDPDDWDGDEPEAVILARFVEWLPDLVKHRTAEEIRSQAVGGQYAADMVDPFARNSAGQWVRKSDGIPVPWPVVKE